MSVQRSLALVGVGYWGKNLARNFHALGALHTICEHNPTLLAANRDRYPDVRMVNDYSKVLADSQITSIAIAAPAIQHYTLAKQALIAGKDVYVEKPLCMTVREAEELTRLAQEQARILMVGHILHYHPCVQKLLEMVGKGELGKVQYIVSNRLNLGSIRTEENALWNFAPHDVSLILALCGHRLPDEVRCVGSECVSKGVADVSLTTLRFAPDIRAHIYVSWLNPFKEQRLVVVGSQGLALFDDTKPWKDKLLVYRNHVRWTEGRIPHINPDELHQVEVEEKEPLREECLHFLTCCRDRTTPLTDGAEGLRVMRVLEAAQKSMDAEGEGRNPWQHVDSHEMTEGPLIHPTAVVDAGAKIGAGARVWHFSHIMDGAEVGPDCNIGQNVVVSPGVKLGRCVKVQNNVSLYTGVVCEDEVFIGPSAVFTNVINPRSAISRKDEYQLTQVRTGATIGANATIMCGLELGAHCFIGAGAVVTKDVKPYALVYGNPAKQVGWMSAYGHRLDLPVALADGAMREASCPGSGEVYRLEGDCLSSLLRNEGASKDEPSVCH